MIDIELAFYALAALVTIGGTLTWAVLSVNACRRQSRDGQKSSAR